MRLFQRRIQDRKIQKTYLALVVGIPKEKEGYIESFLGRDPYNRKKITADNPLNPKLAKTKFKVLGVVDEKYALLEVDLLTGRTHQIRVHLASIGFPIVGDTTYGRAKINSELEEKYALKRQWLHAYRLGFDLFKTRFEFRAALKEDLLRFPISHLGDFTKSTSSRDYYGGNLPEIEEELLENEEDLDMLEDEN